MATASYAGSPPETHVPHVPHYPHDHIAVELDDADGLLYEALGECIASPSKYSSKRKAIEEHLAVLARYPVSHNIGWAYARACEDIEEAIRNVAQAQRSTGGDRARFSSLAQKALADAQTLRTRAHEHFDSWARPLIARGQRNVPDGTIISANAEEGRRIRCSLRREAARKSCGGRQDKNACIAAADRAFQSCMAQK
ncbi:MAG TPA: hypothetical protein VG323_06055 [Thermoanaerobaculia bacterium]|nr:hypothetical protein [Thermoanaerobaculia bacterium]